MFGIGGGELLLILIIALFFLGPKKLPELAKGLGQAIKEFQKAKDGFNEKVNEEINKAQVAQTPESARQIEKTTDTESEIKKS